MTRRDSSLLLEYQRMREEKEIQEIHDNIPAVKSMFDIPGITNVTPLQKPEITSFPDVDGGDTVDGAQTKKHSHMEASEYHGHRHGAKLCMISAVVHMKRLALRKPKSIQELRQNPLTTQQEEALRHVDDVDDDSEDESKNDIFAHVRKCRYLRGTNEDQELSIEEIFH